MPNWKITFEIDPIGLFFFSVIGLGIIETLVDFSGLLIRSLADILQFRFGPCSNKITIEPYYSIDNKTKKEEKTRGSQGPVIDQLVFNLTSKVDRKWGCYT